MRRLPDALRFIFRATGCEAVVRLVGCALAIGIGRLVNPRGGPALRVREAQRLSAVLGALKGPFAKVGQFASLRVDVVAPEIRDGLVGLRERVPPLHFGTIRAAIERELGGPLGEHFATFDPEPLGTASIGQVHRARTRDGLEVAVKVQFPWLRAALRSDLAVMRVALRLVAGADASGRRAVLFDEFAAGVREELDFRREAGVAREIAQNLASDAQLVVPRVVDALSTGRILTMTYHATLPITDRARLEARGIAPAEVLQIVARAYCRQVFVDGLFHADPHPGNLFVLDEPGAPRPRVLFLDFGLSKRLGAELRSELRAGIYALLKGDLDGFVDGMQRLGMIAPGAEPDVRDAVRAMFERMRGDAAGGALAMSGGSVLALKDEAKALLEQTPGLQLPHDLLLYARTLSYVFALGEELAPEVDMMKLAVPYLLQFLAASDR